MKSISKLRKKETANNGITLIALVITIIVLLILAGVSIATLTGQNGVLTKANTAQKETEIENAKEQAKVDIAAWIADKLENGEKAELDDSIIKTIITGKDYVSTEEGQPGNSSFKTKENGYEIFYSDLYNDATSADTYTITYDAKGGEGAPVDNTKYHKGDTVTVDLATIPTRDGYEFLGWANSNNADTPDYAIGKETTFVLNEGNKIIYAVWGLKIAPCIADGSIRSDGSYAAVPWNKGGTWLDARRMGKYLYDGIKI